MGAFLPVGGALYEDQDVQAPVVSTPTFWEQFGVFVRQVGTAVSDVLQTQKGTVALTPPGGFPGPTRDGGRVVTGLTGNTLFIVVLFILVIYLVAKR